MNEEEFCKTCGIIISDCNCSSLDFNQVIFSTIPPCGENIIEIKSNDLLILTFYCVNEKDHEGDCSYSMSFVQNDEDVTITLTKSRKPKGDKSG